MLRLPIPHILKAQGGFPPSKVWQGASGFQPMTEEPQEGIPFEVSSLKLSKPYLSNAKSLPCSERKAGLLRCEDKVRKIRKEGKDLVEELCRREAGLQVLCRVCTLHT